MDNKTLAIIAFILAFLLPIVGLILGIVALVKIKNSIDKAGKVLAIAAVVVSVLFMILVIPFIIIGGIAYFGVLSPQTLLPDEKCTFPLGMRCIDYTVTGNSVDLILVNDQGRDMKISSVTFTGTDVQGECKAMVDKDVLNGGSVQVKATGCSIDAGGMEMTRITAKVNYALVDSLTLKQTMIGYLLTKVN